MDLIIIEPLSSITSQILAENTARTQVLDVLWCQQIKQIQAVSTSEFHEY
jgi:hypothetical protein